MELPEVEVMRRDLEKDVVGRKVVEAEVRPSKNAMRVIRRHAKRKEFSDRLVGRKFTKAERRGKYVLLHMDNGDVLVTHFGMSGQFVRANKRVPLPPHTHVVLTFAQGGDLRFVDPRTFGEMFVATTDELGKVKELQHLAIDPLDHVFTWQAFGAALAQRGTKMKQLLMDQKFVSGLGNIYSDDILFRAGVRGIRPAGSITDAEIARIHRASRAVLEHAVEAGGSSLADAQYVDLYGQPGRFQLSHAVHAPAGEPCPRCGATVTRQRMGGRFGYWCPRCQS